MRIGMGCVTLGTARGGSWRHDVRLVQTAIDQGVEVLDVADAYGNGMSERIVGQAIRSRRDEVEVATKGGYLFRERSRTAAATRRAAKTVLGRLPVSGVRAAVHPSGSSAYRATDFSPDHLRDALDQSLRRLGTDHVDVYQLHGPPAAMPEVLDALQSTVVAGKVRRLGVGTESVDSARSWATVKGLDVLQLPLGLLDRESIAVAESAHGRSVEVWARGVFGGGVLAAAPGVPGIAVDDAKARLVVALRELAQRAGIDVYTLALGFVRAIPAVSTVLIGMSSEQHLERNLALAMGPPLPPDVLAELTKVLVAADWSGQAP